MKTKTNTKKITRAAWHKFLNAVTLKTYLLCGTVPKFAKYSGRWEWEEHEDLAGTYFVNFYAKTEDEVAPFENILKEAVAERGWQFDTCAKFGEFEPEKYGTNRGRRLVYFYIAPTGTWEE